MATFDQNLLQAVRTYQDDGVKYLLNYGALINNANKSLDNFQDLPSQLGSTVAIKLPYQFLTQNTLAADFQSIVQNIATLTVNEEFNVSIAMSAEEFLFNLENEGDRLLKGAIVQLGTSIEKSLATLFETAPYRFYGHGESIVSYGQLAQAYANQAAYGMADDQVRGFIHSLAVPNIVNSGSNVFAPMRNDEIVHKWMVGEFTETKWYRSNLLKKHISGTVGNSNQVLTIVSTNDSSGNAITQITVSGATPNDANAIKKYDNLWFLDQDLNTLTWTGQADTPLEVQIQATADAPADGSGNVIINITPTLCSQVKAVQNINLNIVPGMQLKAVPSHYCGALVTGNAMYMAMPRMPSTTPYPSATKKDDHSDASFRVYHGYQFPKNVYGVIHDAIMGKMAIPQYVQKIVFPLTQFINR